jgi:predicted ArsR family transcriptional regulator
MEPADPRSRRAILNLLKQRGPTDSTTLAAALKLTPMAVRLHLYALRDQKIVDHVEESRAIGRPAKLWRLTSQAHRIFPDAHAELSVSLIEAMGQAFGPSGLDQLLQIRKKKQSEAYAQALQPLSTLPERLQALAEIRTREGYMAEVQPLDPGVFLFVENHCPICAAATACLGFCVIELETFREVLGPAVRIEREEHILAGARRCAYRVSPLSPVVGLELKRLAA